MSRRLRPLTLLQDVQRDLSPGRQRRVEEDTDFRLEVIVGGKGLGLNLKSNDSTFSLSAFYPSPRL